MEIILYVEDMNAQVSFYRDTLGLPVTYPAGLEDYGDQVWAANARHPEGNRFSIESHEE